MANYSIPKRWVKIKGFALINGESVDAVEKQIKRNPDWLEGIMWKKGPDNRIYINVEAHDLWVEGKPVKLHGRKVSPTAQRAASA